MCFPFYLLVLYTLLYPQPLQFSIFQFGFLHTPEDGGEEIAVVLAVAIASNSGVEKTAIANV